MATKKLKQFDRVEVSWNDHYSTHHGWTDNSHVGAMKLFKCSTIGYFMSEDDDHLFVVQTLNDMGEHINLMSILKNGITKVQKL